MKSLWTRWDSCQPGRHSHISIACTLRAKAQGHVERWHSAQWTCGISSYPAEFEDFLQLSQFYIQLWSIRIVGQTSQDLGWSHDWYVRVPPRESTFSLRQKLFSLSDNSNVTIVNFYSPGPADTFTMLAGLTVAVKKLSTANDFLS